MKNILHHDSITGCSCGNHSTQAVPASSVSQLLAHNRQGEVALQSVCFVTNTMHHLVLGALSTSHALSAGERPVNVEDAQTWLSTLQHMAVPTTTTTNQLGSDMSDADPFVL